MKELHSFYLKKISLLDLLKKNLTRQLELLSYGDGENTAKISYDNEAIIKKMQRIDSKIEKLNENFPANSDLIEITNTMFILLNETREMHRIVSEKFKKIVIGLKEELNTISVKRQLKIHLHTHRQSWNRIAC